MKRHKDSFGRLALSRGFWPAKAPEGWSTPERCRAGAVSTGAGEHRLKAYATTLPRWGGFLEWANTGWKSDDLSSAFPWTLQGKLGFGAWVEGVSEGLWSFRGFLERILLDCGGC